MNARKLQTAIERLEILYWDMHRNGGPDLEVQAILRLCEEARDTTNRARMTFTNWSSSRWKRSTSI